jgi:hypothetical protein
MKLLPKGRGSWGVSRRKRMVIAAAGGVGLVAFGVAVSPLSILSWNSRLSHWPHVPPPELYVTAQPKQEDVAGVYELTGQTITKNGLAVLEGRTCRLDLRPDGSFSVTNYPQWSPDSSPEPRIVSFISTTGRWRCDDTRMLSGRGRPYWSVLFLDTPAGMDSLALRSKGAPYDLMLIYGDGDDGTVMMLGKK